MSSEGDAVLPVPPEAGTGGGEEEGSRESGAVMPPAAPGFSFGTASSAQAASPADATAGFSFKLATPTGDEDEDEDDESDVDLEGEPLSREVLQRVLGLKGLQEEYEGVLKEYAAERCELEKKYRALTAPVFAKRAAIIKGDVEPALTSEDEATVAKATTAPTGVEMIGVPDFWLGALGRNEAFEQFLEEDDVEALKYLVDVRCVDHDDMKGFTLEFEFIENPHFTNSVLTKTYAIPNLMDANGQPELERITGCDVDWKNPKDCLVAKEVKKKQKARRGKNAGMTRIVTKLEARPSFFRFFESIKLPTDGSDDSSDDDRLGPGSDDDDEALRERIDSDVELAFALRNHVVPNAVLWFTGEAADDDDDDDDDEDELLRVANQQDDDDDDDDDDA